MHEREGVALTSSEVASSLSHLHRIKYLDMYDMNYKQNNGIPIENATKRSMPYLRRSCHYGNHRSKPEIHDCVQSFSLFCPVLTTGSQLTSR
jgi:hypothetical protein